MAIVSFLLVAFWSLWPSSVASTFTGTWVLNSEKSDFGTEAVLEQLVVHLEHTEGHLTISTFVSDSDGQHINYQDYDLLHRMPSYEILSSTPERIMLRVKAASNIVDEEWYLTRNRNLVITRVLSNQSRTTQQRLVLEPARQVY